MTKQITNNSDIPLVLAVWLVNDDYDYIDHPNYMSATALMKPLRQIILPKRIPPENAPVEDVEDYISRGLGNAIHDSVEKAWKANYRRNLRKLGYPESIIDTILINPEDHELDAMLAKGIQPIPVYLEQRMYRELNGRVLGGKYDNITDGIVNDTKSTSAYSWVFGGKDADYQIQGSIYRWIDAQGHSDVSLDPDTRFRSRITEEYMRVNFVFTDWQKAQARQNKAYPPRRAMEKEIRLLSLEDTEAWLNDKTAMIERYADTPESQIPECTPEELWLPEPKFKFYKDPAKAQQPKARSTKNFDDLMDARKFQAEQGGVGVIKTVQEAPKRCGFCPAFDVCTQKDKYF